MREKESGGRHKLGFYFGTLMYGIEEKIFLEDITKVSYLPMKRDTFHGTKYSIKLYTEYVDFHAEH